MTDLDDIEIETVDLDRITPDEGPRVYYDEEHSLPSVSSVLDVRPTPPALQKYKDKQAEKEGYTDFHLDQGTLSHYELLNPLTEEELWTNDEQSSEDALSQHQEYWDRYQSNQEWLDETWEFVCNLRGITPERTVAVETYVANFDVGYAGQFDLLWVDPDDNIVLGDIKTSKDVYDKYLYQAVAYDHAIDITVDHCEILRMHPDQKVWEISRSDEWIEDTEELWEEFKDYREQLDDERIEEVREQADV